MRSDAKASAFHVRYWRKGKVAMLRVEAVVHAVRGVGNRADSAVAAKSASAAVARAAIAQPSIRRKNQTNSASPETKPSSAYR